MWPRWRPWRRWPLDKAASGGFRGGCGGLVCPEHRQDRPAQRRSRIASICSSSSGSSRCGQTARALWWGVWRAAVHRPDHLRLLAGGAGSASGLHDPAPDLQAAGAGERPDRAGRLALGDELGRWRGIWNRFLAHLESLLLAVRHSCDVLRRSAAVSAGSSPR